MTPPVWLDTAGRRRTPLACWTCGREVAPMRFRVAARPEEGESVAMWFVIVREAARMVPLVALFGTFLVLAATSPRLAYAEAKRAAGTTGSSVVVVNTLIFLASTLDTGQLQSRSRDLISPDPDWNHATVFSTSFWDPAMQLEHKARGHMVITHPGGDQTFLQYEVSWKNVGPIEVEWQFLGSFVRGTGKFKGISGTWREGGKSTSAGNGGNWETEYTLP